MSVEVGQQLPPLTKRPTTQQLVKYAGASGDFYQIHYDQEFARSVGLPGVILHGLLKAAFLGQLVTGWAAAAELQSLDVVYRGMDLPGEPCLSRGLVKSLAGDTAELEIWTEDARGNRTTIGSATVRLKG